MNSPNQILVVGLRLLATTHTALPAEALVLITSIAQPDYVNTKKDMVGTYTHSRRCAAKPVNERSGSTQVTNDVELNGASFLNGATWTATDCVITETEKGDSEPTRKKSPDGVEKIGLSASRQGSSGVADFFNYRLGAGGHKWDACDKPTSADPANLNFAFCGTWSKIDPDDSNLVDTWDACFAQGSKDNWFVFSPNFKATCMQNESGIMSSKYRFMLSDSKPTKQAAPRPDVPTDPPDHGDDHPTPSKGEPTPGPPPASHDPDDDDDDEGNDDNKGGLPSWLTDNWFIIMLVAGGALLLLVLTSKAS